MWVRIYEIPQEYFHEHVIESIASALGTVVSMDQCTRDGSMCHYARVLIELDLRKEKEYHIMFERAGHCSIALVGYEPHPDFCMHCQIVGHSFINYRSRKKDSNKEGKGDVPGPHASNLGGPNVEQQKGAKWV